MYSITYAITGREHPETRTRTACIWEGGRRPSGQCHEWEKSEFEVIDHHYGRLIHRCQMNNCHYRYWNKVEHLINIAPWSWILLPASSALVMLIPIDCSQRGSHFHPNDVGCMAVLGHTFFIPDTCKILVNKRGKKGRLTIWQQSMISSSFLCWVSTWRNSSRIFFCNSKTSSCAVESLQARASLTRSTAMVGRSWIRWMNISFHFSTFK